MDRPAGPPDGRRIAACPSLRVSIVSRLGRFPSRSFPVSVVPRLGCLARLVAPSIANRAQRLWPRRESDRSRMSTDSGVDDGAAIVDRLVAASVVRVDESTDDLALTETFRADLRRRIDQVGDDPTRYLALLLEADPEALSVEDDEEVTAVRDDSGSATRAVGEWPSKAALVADVAAFVALSEWLPAFEELDGTERDELVARLRAFLETCPICDGALIEESDAEEAAVPAIACAECGAALF